MIRGIVPPIVTLFKEDGSIDYEATRRQVNFLIEHGVNGIFFLGSSGEMASLTHEERKEIARFAVESVKGRVPILIGTGSTFTEQTVELSRHAEQVGADGVAVIAPYYMRQDEEAVKAYYGAVAEAVGISVFVYNFPDITGFSVPTSLLVDLATRYPNVSGVKDTVDGTTMQRSRILTLKPLRPDFSCLAGFDDNLLANLALGGDGSVPGSANVAPELSVSVYKAFAAGNYAEAIAGFQKLARLVQLFSLPASFIALVKEAMMLRGLAPNAVTRRPILPVSQEVRESAKAILSDLNLL